MTKELDGGKAFRDLLGKLAQVPKKEADRRAALERKRKAQKRKPKR
jgi:hypothetical protein